MENEQEKQPSQEAIDFLFAAKMGGKITEKTQTDPEIQMLVTTLLEQRQTVIEEASVLQHEVDDLNSLILDLKQDIKEVELESEAYEQKYDEARAELNSLFEGGVLPSGTLQDEMKNKILVRFGEQLTLEQVEALERDHVRFTSYNPHV